MRPSRSALALLTGALVLGALPLAAQTTTDPDPWSVLIEPRVGFMQPGESGPLQGWAPEGLSVRGGPVVGLAIELRTPAPWFSLRATVERSARNNLRFDAVQPISPFTDALVGSRPSGLQSQYSVGGILRPLRSLPIRPTLTAGVGLRHWAFDPAGLPASLVPRFPETDWNRTAHWGVGVDADARPIGVRLELVNYHAWIDEPTLGEVEADDRFLMVSLRWTGWS